MFLLPEENQQPVLRSNRFSSEMWQFSLDVKQKHIFYKRKSTKKKSLRSAHLTIIILLEYYNNNNNNTIWGVEACSHPSRVPTQSQPSRPMSSGHHISMEHRLRRKQLNSDTNASNKTYLKEIQEKRKEETFSFEKMKKWKNL